MTCRKWSLTAALLILLAAPGAASAQIGGRGVFAPPRNDRGLVAPAVGALGGFGGITQRGAGAGLFAPRGAGVVSALPRNRTEFGYVHGRRPTAAEVDSMARTRLGLSRLGESNLTLRPEARTRRGFEDYAREGRERVVVLTGHNERGKLRFPDGSTIKLAEAERLLHLNGKEAVLLSCDAQQYVSRSAAARRKINDRDALRMTERIGKSLGGGNNSSGGGGRNINSPRGPLGPGGNHPGSLQDLINGYEAGALRTKVLVAGGGLVGAGGGIIALAPERKSKRRR